MENLKSKIWWSIPITFLLGAAMHFVYGILENNFIAVICPVDESIFQHLKLSFYPILIWWVIQFITVNIRHNNDDNSDINCKIIVCTFVSCIVSMLTIICFFYAYTGMFGIDIAVLDVFSLLLGIAVGQFLSLHIYNNIKCNKFIAIISILALLVVIALFIVWTFNPPHIPFFKDPLTNSYGI